MKYIQTLTEKGKLKWQDSDAPDANGRFRDLSPKDLAAWLIKTRKGDMKKISGSLSQQVAFNKSDDPEYAKKMDKTRKEVYKQLDREDLLESVLNEEDTWNDYPAAAKKNAQKAIDWKEEHGRDEVDAGTPVGWARAHQLAKGENLSTDTVKRMSAFNRHRKNSSIKPELKETPWKDRGYVAWLIWGGDEGVDWAIEKSKEIDAMKESKQLKYVKSLNEAEKYITDEFKVGDKIKTGFGEWEVIETDYAPNKSFIAPFIFKGKDMKRVNIPNPPKTNKNAVGYKVTDGDKYPIIGFLYKYKDITKLATVGVDESVTEKLTRGLKPLLTIGSTITKKDGEDALLDLSDKFDSIDDEYAGTIASWLDMAIELMQDGYSGDATKKLKQFNKACKDVLNGKEVGSAFESVTEASRSKVHKAAKQGSYPAVIVVVQDGKVIHQEPVSTPDVAPATFNVMQEKYPKAILHLEDNTGKRLFSESVVAEDVETIENLNHMAHTDLERIADYADMIKDRMSKGQDLDAWMYHKISDSVSNLNSVHDTMDGTDGVVENITEGMSKSAIKKAIKVIDQQIEDEEGGDGEPLDNETLQALEQERERLLAMNELVYIKPLSESVGGYEYGKWIKENGKIKYPKWVTVTRKEIIKKGLMDSVYDSESHNMSIWINSLGKNFFVINADSKKREKEFGKNGSAFINAYYNDITGYTAFAWEAATICLELIKHIEDRIANSEEVEPGYYIAKEYFNNFGMDTKRSRIFDLTTKKLDAWMEDNQIATL